jgi:hypothetical protein
MEGKTILAGNIAKTLKEEGKSIDAELIISKTCCSATETPSH